MRTAYLAAPDFSDQLLAELTPYGQVSEVADRVYLQDGPAHRCAWAVDVWFDVHEVPIESIGDAARILKSIQPFWRPLLRQEPRRTGLIADKLGLRPLAQQEPPDGPKLRPSGVFTLLSRDRLLYASAHSRPFPGGEPPLTEDHCNPPSRAYRKLWEALLLLGDTPQPGQKVYDLGASPGSWTWALARYGCEVIAIDKAPLDDRITALPNVSFQQGSAFALDPRHNQADWICSDIICYPKRLHTFVDRWIELGNCQRFVLTVKLQGVTDFDALKAFQDLPNGVTTHLWFNKHEVTWIGHPSLSRDSTPQAWPWIATKPSPE
ncbi:MAG: hypothetical protein PF961_09325 [Planctomycetota bacterium]|jgi:23S rRNA (cytidine2498-2'-O)-methyltransferase|nr:hypothetical protein [Planctomycetota bacterium]